MSSQTIKMLAVIIALLAGLYVYKNAKNRGGSGVMAFGWALVVMYFPMLFFPAYLLFRPKKAN